MHCHKIGPLNHDREHHKTLVHQVSALHAPKRIQNPNSQKARAHFSCGPTSLINHNQKREGFWLLGFLDIVNFACYGLIVDVHWLKRRAWHCQTSATTLSQRIYTSRAACARNSGDRAPTSSGAELQFQSMSMSVARLFQLVLCFQVLCGMSLHHRCDGPCLFGCVFLFFF